MERLWYKKSAKYWDEALPVGNGRLGAMVYGGVCEETIQVNEESVWSGAKRNRINPDSMQYLPKIRKLLEEGKIPQAQRTAVDALSGTPQYQRAYQTLGEIKILHHGINGTPKSYKRELKLADAEAYTEFTVDGTVYCQSIFASFPDDCIVIVLRAQGEKKLDFHCRLDRGRHFDRAYASGQKEIAFEGNNSGLGFYGALRCMECDGNVKTTGEHLIIDNASCAVLLFSAATTFRSQTPDQVTEEILDKAERKTLEELKKDHRTDFGRLYHKMKLEFARDEEAEVLPVDERLERLRQGKEDPGLFALYFHYARYLMISCSRKGGLPANLQGIWNHHMRAPWSSNYTVNINTEMNYWMAEKANLSDCHMPLLELIERTSKKGEKTAQDVYHLAGWVSHHNLDIWGHSSPVGQFGQDENPCTYSMWPMSSGWLCCHLWEHYCYTLDEAFLKKKAFPIIQGAVEFYLGYLVPYKGYYVTAPSTSPENTFLAPDMTTHSVTFASTMDISILRELFGLYLKACEILGVEDFTNAVKNVLQKLPPYKIGKEGQLQEWFYDYPEADINHRHISHLFGLYPGNQIHKENEPLIEACRTSLERRGDKGTGWCMAWKACLWAKLGDGNHALTLLKNQLRLTREEACSLVGGGIYPNMLCAHPPFQIDGNFGFAAAVLEMLVQYEEQKIVFLPALPDEWKDGMAEGVKAPGNITLNFKWKEKRVTEINLKSPIDAKLVILYNGMEEEIVLNAGSSYQKTLI